MLVHARFPVIPLCLLVLSVFSAFGDAKKDAAMSSGAVDKPKGEARSGFIPLLDASFVPRATFAMRSDGPNGWRRLEYIGPVNRQFAETRLCKERLNQLRNQKIAAGLGTAVTLQGVNTCFRSAADQAAEMKRTTGRSRLKRQANKPPAVEAAVGEPTEKQARTEDPLAGLFAHITAFSTF